MSQGSISGDEFRRMIRHLKKDYDILDAGVWYGKAMEKKLKPKEICLTFDDALSCQFDIAYPIMKEIGITAFWFVYTSMYKGFLEKLEVYRRFRFKNFDFLIHFMNYFSKLLFRFRILWE